MKPSKQKHVTLPTTEEEFDSLVDAVVAKYKLKNREHAESVIAIRISHMPPDQAVTTLEYFGHCVIKNIAFQIAQRRASLAQHKVQVDQLDACLSANPYDKQAYDALQKAVNEGSEYAKTIFAKYSDTDTGETVTELKAVEAQ